MAHSAETKTPEQMRKAALKLQNAAEAFHLPEIMKTKMTEDRAFHAFHQFIFTLLDTRTLENTRTRYNKDFYEIFYCAEKADQPLISTIALTNDDLTCKDHFVKLGLFRILSHMATIFKELDNTAWIPGFLPFSSKRKLLDTQKALFFSLFEKLQEITTSNPKYPLRVLTQSIARQFLPNHAVFAELKVHRTHLSGKALRGLHADSAPDMEKLVMSLESTFKLYGFSLYLVPIAPAYAASASEGAGEIKAENEARSGTDLAADGSGTGLDSEIPAAAPAEAARRNSSDVASGDSPSAGAPGSSLAVADTAREETTSTDIFTHSLPTHA